MKTLHSTEDDFIQDTTLYNIYDKIEADNNDLLFCLLILSIVFIYCLLFSLLVIIFLIFLLLLFSYLWLNIFQPAVYEELRPILRDLHIENSSTNIEISN